MGAISLDFKKVHDCEKKAPFGMPSYYAISAQDKKTTTMQ